MFHFYTKVFTRTLSIRSGNPTVEGLEEIFKQYKADNPVDYVVTDLLHRFAKKKVKSGFIDGPGDYLLSVRVKFPIMFWDHLYYKIERL